MTTEDVSPRHVDLDVWGTLDAVNRLLDDQLAAVLAVKPALPALAAAVDSAAARLRQGGRLVYVGAGTSARIGVQDGAELAPTFSWPPERVAFAIAGGEAALLRAVENAEDSAEAGAARMAELGIDPGDVVIGLAASGKTPFTISAVRAAAQRGAMTIGVASNPGSPLLAASSHPILAETGEEPIAGSTRFKAGTAQKVVLNLFSTMVMVRLGKVYRGLMVDMRPTNDKLRRRAQRMVEMITGCDDAASALAMASAEGNVKLAVLLARGLGKAEAIDALRRNGDRLGPALAELGQS